jgi:dihydroorotate dehydrogenase (NAD+) catalytic subunit
MIELNISCPNVKAGGMSFGMDCASAASVTKAVRAVSKKPLMVKLTPNAPDVVGIALAVREAGADAISLVNTFQAMAIDVHTGKPVFDNVRAGFSGPAVKPIALRIVYDVVQAMNRLPEADRIPVVGLGGIASWQDAVEFIMAGASAVQVGTATFANPLAMVQIVDGIAAFMRERGFTSLSDFRGSAQSL